MKFAWHMYHLNSFYLPKNKRGNEWAGGRRIQKTIKKSPEILKTSTLTSRKNGLKNARKVRLFLLSFLTI